LLPRPLLQAGQLGKAIRDALNATAEAAARLNATSQALKAVEQQKTDELVGMVAQLAQEEEAEERAEEKKEQYEQHTAGRKEGLGFAAGVAKTGADAAGAGAAAGGAAARNGTAAQGPPGSSGGGGSKPRAEVREALKQAVAAAAGSGGNGSAVNVTQMAQAAIDAATTVVASSKASVEQSIEKMKPKVGGGGLLRQGA
jgi:hypothetical protein